MMSDNQNLTNLMSHEQRYVQFKEFLNQAEGLCKELLVKLYNLMNKEISYRDEQLINLRALVETLEANLSIVLKDPTNEKIAKLNQDKENLERELLEARRMLTSPDSVATTSTVMQARAELDLVRACEAYRLPLGVNFQNMELISQAHAQEIVRDRAEIKDEDRALECWTDRNLNPNEKYSSIQLRNTYSRVPGHINQKIGIDKLYLHQLALIAKGDLERLSWCTQANSIFQVSHLCHRNHCFNPNHLIVEESTLNKARNTCQGHEIVIYGGLRYHPCPHAGASGVHPRCILPRRIINEPGDHNNEHYTI